jgi:hypothetical protein
MPRKKGDFRMLKWLDRHPYLPWGIIGIVVTLLFAAVVSDAIEFDVPRVPDRQSIDAVDGNYQPLRPSCRGQAIDGLPNEAERILRKERCDDERERRRVDVESLNQSIRATNAAEEGVWLAFYQTRTGYVQAILTVLALSFSAWASIVASRAAIAAEKSIEQSAHSTRMQLRAYLHVEGVDVEFSAEGDLAFSVKVKNTGQTPSKYFEIAVEAIAVEFGSKIPDVPEFDSYNRWPAIGGNGCERVGFCRPINREGKKFQHFISSPIMLFAVGRVRYEDVFGKNWEEEFKVFTRNPSSKPSKMSHSTQ